MAGKRLLPLFLIFCLVAGCANPTESSTPPAPPTESVGQPAPESQPEPPAEPAPEEPELPDALAGADGYYTPGHRLTLYAMEPGTGTIRTVREEDFWNGREVESVSPSGNRVLLSSWNGAPSRRVVALSLYDLETDTLVNLCRENPVELDGNWQEGHWFPGKGRYCFVDEDTFCYRRFCSCGEAQQSHVHRYHIGKDCQVTAELLPLECPERKEGWESQLILLPEQGQMLCDLRIGEDSFEWFTWDMASGKLISRVPEKNGWSSSAGLYRDGVLYDIEQVWEEEKFHLTAYHMDTDTVEVLADGRIPKAPGMEEEPIDARGVLESVWLAEIREDGTFVIRSAGEGSRYGAVDSYREVLWDPAAGGEIQLGERQEAPAFPVDSLRGYTSVFAVMPDGEGGYVPLPQEMAARYQEWDSGRPYPIATLPGGELLFLARDPVETLPQEDPEQPGELAGAVGNTGGHRLSLYRFSLESGQTTLVRYPGFWNGLAVEDVSPSGNRLLLATRDKGGQAALSVYDIRENLLFNLSYEKNFDGTKWEWKHWFPGEYRYRFVSEDTFLYEGLTYSTVARQYYLPRWCLTEYGLNSWNEWVIHPKLPEHPNLPCIYCPENQTILCDLPLEDGTQRFTWQVDVEARNNNGGRQNNLLSQAPVEDSLPLEGARPPEGPPTHLPLPERMGPIWPIVALPTGEILFLAR